MVETRSAGDIEQAQAEARAGQATSAAPTEPSAAPNGHAVMTEPEQPGQAAQAPAAEAEDEGVPSVGPRATMPRLGHHLGVVFRTPPLGEITATVLSGLAAGGFLLIASLARPAGIGMGDVKLTGMMGLFLGRSVAVALFAALIASVLTGVALATRRGVHAARKTALPFGLYLAGGGILAALVGDAIVRAYLHLHG